MKRIIKYSDIIQNQSTINIGCLGSVSEGKSTTVRQLSKTDPHRHQKEREKNSTVNLGYANFKIWKNIGTSELVTTKGELEQYGPDWTLIRHISFVDCPGHENFMTTMMSGTGVMDGVLLLIAANSPEIPLRQTAEHMAVLERTDISKILVLQNKIDLLHTKNDAIQNKEQIRKFLETNQRAANAPIFPISAQLGTNLEWVLKWLVNEFKTSELQEKINQPLFLPIIRSFDVNKPGTPANKLVGGVIGGSITNGFLEKNDCIEIRPGIARTIDGKRVWVPVLAKVTSINIGQKQLDYAVPGGLIGIGLSIDSFWTVGNKLVGQVVGHPGKMPKVYTTLRVKIVDYLIKGMHFLDFQKDEIVLIITGNNVVRGKFSYRIKEELANLELVVPVCIPLKSKVAVAKLDGTKSTLAFIGELVKGLGDQPEGHPSSNPEREVQIIGDEISSSEEVVQILPYNDLLESFVFNKEREKFKIPTPHVIIENKKTAIANIANLLQKVHHFAVELEAQKGCCCDVEIQELFRKFIAAELIKNARYTGGGALLIDGIFQLQKVQSVIEQYTKKYIACSVCQSSKTVYQKDYVICHNCGGRQFIEKH